MDSRMKTAITNNSKGPLQENSLNLWKDDIEKEELKSLQRWMVSALWFHKYESNFTNKHQTSNPYPKQTKSNGPPNTHPQQH